MDPLGCTRQCGKKRSACGHPCDKTCHPSEKKCPLDPCKYQVKIKCKCGNRTTFVECGSTDKKLSKELPCEAKCHNLQRFKALYEKTAKKVYYPGFLVKFAKNNFSYLTKLEKKFSDLLLGTENTCTLSVDKGAADRLRSLLTLTSKHYLLEVICYKSLKSNSLIITKTEESIIPQITLSEYLIKINNGDMDVDQEPFDAKIRFFSLSYYETSKELEKIIQDISDECYIETDKNGIVKMYVWNKESIPGISKRLQKSGTGFSMFEVEIYSKKNEEEEDMEDEVIVKESEWIDSTTKRNVSGEVEGGEENGKKEEEGVKNSHPFARFNQDGVESGDDEVKKVDQLEKIQAESGEKQDEITNTEGKET